MVPGGQWGVPGGPRVLPGGFSGGYKAQNECLGKFEKGCVWPPGGGLGVPLYVILRNLTPSGARLMRKVLQDDNSAPFSSDKIRAKILDLGYGGARRALHNLCPKSARILSAAITRTILLPAGVRESRDGFHSGVS